MRIIRFLYVEIRGLMEVKINLLNTCFVMNHILKVRGGNILSARAAMVGIFLETQGLNRARCWSSCTPIYWLNLSCKIELNSNKVYLFIYLLKCCAHIHLMGMGFSNDDLDHDVLSFKILWSRFCLFHVLRN